MTARNNSAMMQDRSNSNLLETRGGMESSFQLGRVVSSTKVSVLDLQSWDASEPFRGVRNVVWSGSALTPSVRKCLNSHQ